MYNQYIQLHKSLFIFLLCILTTTGLFSQTEKAENLTKRIKKTGDVEVILIGLEHLSKVNKFTESEDALLGEILRQIKINENGRSILDNIPLKLDNRFDEAIVSLIPRLVDCRNINYYFYDIIKLLRVRESELILSSVKNAYNSNYEHTNELDYIFYKSLLIRTILDIDGIDGLEYLMDKIFFEESVTTEFSSYSKHRNTIIEFFKLPENSNEMTMLSLEYILATYIDKIRKTGVEKQKNMLESTNHSLFLLDLATITKEEDVINSVVSVLKDNDISIQRNDLPKLKSESSIPILDVDSKNDFLVIDSLWIKSALNDVILIAYDRIDWEIFNDVLTNIPSEINRSQLVQLVKKYIISYNDKQDYSTLEDNDLSYLSEYLVDRYFNNLGILFYAITLNNLSDKLSTISNANVGYLVQTLNENKSKKHFSKVSQKYFNAATTTPDSITNLIRSGKYKLSVEHREYNFETGEYYEYIRIDDYNNKHFHFKAMGYIPLKFHSLIKSYPNIIDDLNMSLFEYRNVSFFGKKTQKYQMIDIYSHYGCAIFKDILSNNGKIISLNRSLFLASEMGRKNSLSYLVNFDMESPKIAKLVGRDPVNLILSDLEAIPSLNNESNIDFISIIKSGSKVFDNDSKFNSFSKRLDELQEYSAICSSNEYYFSHINQRASKLCNPRGNKWYEIYRIPPDNIPDKKRWKKNLLETSDQKLTKYREEKNKVKLFSFEEINELKTVIPFRMYLSPDLETVISLFLIKDERYMKIFFIKSPFSDKESGNNFKPFLKDLITDYPYIVTIAGLDILEGTSKFNERFKKTVEHFNNNVSNLNYLFTDGLKYELKYVFKNIQKYSFLLENSNGEILFDELLTLSAFYDSFPISEGDFSPSNRLKTEHSSLKEKFKKYLNQSNRGSITSFDSDFNKKTKYWCDSGFFIGSGGDIDTDFSANLGINYFLSKYLEK